MITDRREAVPRDGFPRSFSGTALVDGKRVHVVEGVIQGWAPTKPWHFVVVFGVVAICFVIFVYATAF